MQIINFFELFELFVIIWNNLSLESLKSSILCFIIDFCRTYKGELIWLPLKSFIWCVEILFLFLFFQFLLWLDWILIFPWAWNYLFDIELIYLTVEIIYQVPFIIDCTWRKFLWDDIQKFSLSPVIDTPELIFWSTRII